MRWGRAIGVYRAGERDAICVIVWRDCHRCEPSMMVKFNGSQWVPADTGKTEEPPSRLKLTKTEQGWHLTRDEDEAHAASAVGRMATRRGMRVQQRFYYDTSRYTVNVHVNKKDESAAAKAR